MPSRALETLHGERRDRFNQIMDAHKAVRGSGPGRRWTTEQVSHAAALCVASQFQGFFREMHTEVGQEIAHATTDVPALRSVILQGFMAGRGLDRGNATKDVLAGDFVRYGVQLWPDLQANHSGKVNAWTMDLQLLNDARNGISHADETKIRRAARNGFSAADSRQVRKMWSSLDRLSKAMDDLMNKQILTLTGVQPW